MEKLVFPAKLEKLGDMLKFIEDGARSRGLDDKKINQVKLASEEILTNIINYSYPDKNGDVQITYKPGQAEGLEVEIVDWGIPFNPLEQSAPDINVPLEQRKIGGLGIYLVRNIMDEVNYKRQDSRNILTFIKHREEAGMACQLKPENQTDTRKKDSKDDFSWLLSYMKKEKFRKGEMLFKMGDKADKMYYINKGSIKLAEINKIINEGQVIGEMGIFSPYQERMASAVCAEDLEAYTLSKDELLKLCEQDHVLVFNLMQLSFARFIENLKKETETKERIKSELRIARDIQVNMLPGKFPPFPERKEFDIFATMEAAKEVGGDFYDFFFVDENKLCFLIGDVSGKGIPSALFMAITKTLLKTEALRGVKPDEILSRVNNILFPDNDACMFVTVFCVILDLETGRIQFANGGHNPPLIYSGSSGFDYLEAPKGLVVGIMPDTRFGYGQLLLKPEDAIFLYTDGVTEAMNPEGKMFSEERLKSCLVNFKGKDVSDMIYDVEAEIKFFVQGAQQSDDITMLALKYHGAKGI